MSNITGGNYIQLQNIENTNNTAEQFAAQQSDIDNNTLNITENTNNITQNTYDISQNTYDISQNTYDISQNTYDISQNIYDISLLNARVTQNETDISNIDTTSLEPRVAQNETDIASNKTKLSGISYYSPSDTTYIYNRLQIQAAVQDNETTPQFQIRNSATDPNNQVSCQLQIGVEDNSWTSESDEGDILYLCRKYNLGSNTYTGSFLITRHGNVFTGAKFSMDPAGTTKIVTGTCEITADLLIQQKILATVTGIDMSNTNLTNVDEIKFRNNNNKIATFNLDGYDDLELTLPQTTGAFKITNNDGTNISKFIVSQNEIDCGGKSIINTGTTTGNILRTAICRVKINASNVYKLHWQKGGAFIKHVGTNEYVLKQQVGKISLLLDSNVVDNIEFCVHGQGRQYGDADQGSGRSTFVTMVYKSAVYSSGVLVGYNIQLGMNRSHETNQWHDLIYTNSNDYGWIDVTVNY